MKVVIGSDHAGFVMKTELIRFLDTLGHTVEDVGTHGPESVDYPDFAQAVGERIQVIGNSALGILVCGTGVGISIAANKMHGIRAARCDDPYTAKMSRAHNDANVLCLGARVIGPGLAEDTVRAFLETPFEAGRHQLRVDKINKLDH